MSWKDIPKSSYEISSVKFTLSDVNVPFTLESDSYSTVLPRPARPFTIPRQGPKLIYSEGDELSSVADFIFNLDFTGVPLGPDHFPCGYWHKDYIPPFTIIYTSLLYPVEVYDSVNVELGLIAGEFYVDFFAHEYTIPPEGVDVGVVIYSGNFRAPVLTYSYQESISVGLAINSGKFRQAVKPYTSPVEALNVDLTIRSGVYRDALIEYTYWPHEDITVNLTILAGTHNA